MFSQGASVGERTQLSKEESYDTQRQMAEMQEANLQLRVEKTALRKQKMLLRKENVRLREENVKLREDNINLRNERAQLQEGKARLFEERPHWHVDGNEPKSSDLQFIDDARQAAAIHLKIMRRDSSTTLEVSQVINQQSAKELPMESCGRIGGATEGV